MDTYYQPEDLARFDEIGKEAPELARKFFDYYNAVFAEGELTEREKALIALAVMSSQPLEAAPLWFTVFKCAILHTNCPCDKNDPLEMDSQTTIIKPSSSQGQKLTEVMPFKSMLTQHHLELVRKPAQTLQINMGFLSPECRSGPQRKHGRRYARGSGGLCPEKPL
jgi:hypothetical protein